MFGNDITPGLARAVSAVASDMFDAFLEEGEASARIVLEHSIMMLSDCDADARFLNDRAMAQYRDMQFATFSRVLAA